MTRSGPKKEERGGEGGVVCVCVRERVGAGERERVCVVRGGPTREKERARGASRARARVFVWGMVDALSCALIPPRCAVVVVLLGFCGARSPLALPALPPGPSPARATSSDPANQAPARRGGRVSGDRPPLAAPWALSFFYYHVVFGENSTRRLES